jgi:amidohydrolase
MKSILTVFAIVVSISASAEPAKPADGQAMRDKVKSYFPKLVSFYRDLHMHPELGGQEVRTSQKLAGELKALGYKVTTNVGGHGVVAVLKNGEGPTGWIRADMDALPIEEKTGLSYSSKVKNVMHACGHDMHTAAMVGYGRLLVALKSQWKGTLVLIGQPAEEPVSGAQSMINDGLFDKFPKPDYVLALHTNSLTPAGEINYKAGRVWASLDAVDIIVNGKGGHGGAPKTVIDPNVLAAKMLLALREDQTLFNPDKSVILTFGLVQGGVTRNVIPDQTLLQGNLRTFLSEEERDVLRKKIVAVVEKVAASYGAPAPTVKFSMSNPFTFNEPRLTLKTVESFRRVVGADTVKEMPEAMYSEDFARFGENRPWPTSYFSIGVKPSDGRIYGTNHSAKFSPDIEAALPNAILAMTSAVIDLQKIKE